MNAVEYVLWATKIGDENWQEQRITSTTSSTKLASARAWAISQGFDRLRVSKLELKTPPDFVGTVAVKEDS